MVTLSLSVFSQSDHPTVSGCHQLMTKCECQFHGKESWQTQSKREKKLKLNLKGKKISSKAITKVIAMTSSIEIMSQVLNYENSTQNDKQWVILSHND